jgi:hypothetical protein
MDDTKIFAPAFTAGQAVRTELWYRDHHAEVDLRLLFATCFSRVRRR